MQIYLNRGDKSYRQHLLSSLDVESLIASAVDVPYTRAYEDRQLNRCCQIDFLGLAATTLLDIGMNYTNSNEVALKFRELFANAKTINDNGVFIKIRLLFTYPYSSAFLSVVQAESSIHRSSTEEPSFKRDYRTVDEVTDDILNGSSTLQNLRYSLSFVQEMVDEHGWHDRNATNTLRARFTSVGPNICLLIVNNKAFFDPYLFSKQNRFHMRLPLAAPLVEVDRDTDHLQFHHLEDHFRYLWDLDTTLVCDDATQYRPGTPSSLNVIKPPSHVTFQHKASRISELRQEQTNIKTTDEEVQAWSFKVQQMLTRLASDTRPTAAIESLFIACSWTAGNDRRSTPNSTATQLGEWLDEDFGTKQDIQTMSIHILDASLGDDLSSQVYARLREATMALVLLTSDIIASDSKLYAKPNVYHELGYLMRQLDSSRLMVLAQKGVEVPSNVANKVRAELESQKLALTYREVLKWLRENCRLLDRQTLKNALERLVERIDTQIVDGSLDQDEGSAARERVMQDIRKL